MKIGLISFLLLSAGAGILWAAQDTVSVKAELDRAFVTIGDRVEFRITVTHDPSVQIVSDFLPPEGGAFEVKEVHDILEKQGKEVVEGRRFVLIGYQLGEFILEPVTVKYKGAKGEEKSIQTNRLYVTIQSVEPSGKPKTDIRGPKGVIGLPREWGWLWGLSLFLTAVGGGLYVWWLRRRRSKMEARAREPLLSPEDEALLRLSRLFDSDLLKRGKLKEYFLQLSEILRAYFERRYEILAIESTTSEILRDLRSKEVSQNLQAEIQEVLETADLVKFAKWKPPPTEIIRTNQKAKQIVEEARPKSPAPDAASPVTPHGV